MRDLDQYSPQDWLLGRPAVAAFKDVPDAIIRDHYCRRRPQTLERFLAEHSHLRGGTLAVVIAYETKWVIDIFVRRFRQLVPGASLLVADNSRTQSHREEIAEACRKDRAIYFELPPNPARNINRSHVNALNWVYQNLIVPLEPRVFATFDHDIFPTAAVDFDVLLGDQPFYGHKMDRGCGWALWAGYSIFRLNSIAALRPDFNPDMDRGLLTGGRNYGRIFRHYDPSKLRFASHRVDTVHDPQGRPLHSDVIDGWIHIAASSYAEEKIAARDYYERVLENT
jgi:hypothetical protein